MLAIGSGNKTESSGSPRTLEDILDDRRKLDEGYWRMAEKLSIEYENLARTIYK